MDRLRIRRLGRGRPRTRPGRLLADKAYSNRTIRSHLRRRRIKTTIPEKSDQQRTIDVASIKIWLRHPATQHPPDPA
jgi:hypothetical protein